MSAGEVTQQFSHPEMVEMALFSAEFLRHADKHLRIQGTLSGSSLLGLDSEPPKISFFPCGFMHLAVTEEQAESMRTAWKMQM